MNALQEHISHPDRSFRVLRLEQEAFRGGRHRHRQLELTWIQRGSGLRFVGDSVQAYAPGDMVLLGPHLPHAWVSGASASEGSGSNGAPHAATVLQFPPDLLQSAAAPELAPLRTLELRARRGLRVDDPDAHQALRQRLEALPGDAGLAGLAALLGLLDLLVKHAAGMVPLASPGTARQGAATADGDRRVARVIDWVQQHLAEDLTVQAAARLVHVSPAAFSRFFRRELGKSFTQYVNDLRCSEACLRLRHSDKPVAAIAHDCGFATLSHFNRQFKLRLGCAPRDVRRRA